MAKARWIPVAERTPKRPENVLVTVEKNGVRTVTVAYYLYDFRIWKNAFNGRTANVLAWMALKPWEG